MKYCSNCGQKLDNEAKFCLNCGAVVSTYSKNTQSQREVVCDGVIHKCPNCGEILNSFQLNCPACGYELRAIKASSSVKEFALKLEVIESTREYERPRGLFAASAAQQNISKTDKQKISLIKSFTIPNTKEDILEFMILATSCMNMQTYDSADLAVSKSEKEINAAWFSKVQQVYEKAKRSYSADSIFAEIQSLYDCCNVEIKKAKRKGIIKWGLIIGWMPIFFAAIFIGIGIYAPVSEKKETARLESIVSEIESQLKRGEYKYALMNAEALVYEGTIRNEEQERQWAVKREYWIDKIIEEAANNDIILEHPTAGEQEDVNSVDSTSGFIGGLTDGVQPGFDTFKENADEFHLMLSGK